MLVKHAEQTADFDQSDLRTLLDRKLVEFDAAGVTQPPRVTDRGHALLARLHVMR
jgi:hypothetical protein